MDAVPVCDGQRGTGHLKRFSLFLLVDAQESRKRSLPIIKMSRCFGSDRLLPMRNRSTAWRKFRADGRIQLTWNEAGTIVSAYWQLPRPKESPKGPPKNPRSTHRPSD